MTPQQTFREGVRRKHIFKGSSHTAWNTLVHEGWPGVMADLSAVLVGEPCCPAPFREGMLCDAVPEQDELWPLHGANQAAPAADARNHVKARIKTELSHVRVPK